MQRLKSAKNHARNIGSIGKGQSTTKSRDLATSQHTLQLCNVYLDNKNGATQLFEKR